MAKKLPESIMLERDIMHSAESSGGILKRLPQILDTLFKDTKTASSIAEFEKKLKKAEKEQDQNMTKALEWVKEKIVKLRTAIFAQDPSIKHAIERLENALQNTNNLPPAIYLDLILANLQQTVSNLATLENDTFFEGWAKTRRLPVPHNSDDINVTISTTGLHCGILEKLIFPDCIAHMLSRKGPEGLQRLKADRESDPAALLGFLKILSHYALYESTVKSSGLKIRCAQDAEELCLQGDHGPYLHQFSSKNPKDHPLSRKQILRHVDTFLNMVEVQITQKSDKPPTKVNATPKKDSRLSDKKIAVEWMKIEWLNDKETCRDLIVGELIRVIDNGDVKLSRKYERSTYNNWARDADPHPIDKRLRRAKSKNLK
ncbi:MAG: hypothetical protein LLF94_08985 [Chlamydiales bacterium]|nr:hypothetical protein [Chlamydiales bacterium]